MLTYQGIALDAHRVPWRWLDRRWRLCSLWMRWQTWADVN